MIMHVRTPSSHDSSCVTDKEYVSVLPTMLVYNQASAVTHIGPNDTPVCCEAATILVINQTSSVRKKKGACISVYPEGR